MNKNIILRGFEEFHKNPKNKNTKSFDRKYVLCLFFGQEDPRDDRKSIDKVVKK